MNKVGSHESKDKVYEPVIMSPEDQQAFSQQEPKEEHKHGVGWIEHKIRDSKEGSLLGDPMMRAFTEGAKGLHASYDIGLIEEESKPTCYLKMASSPDGRYMAVLCNLSKVRVVDLHALHARDSSQKSPHAQSAALSRYTGMSPSVDALSDDVFVDGPHENSYAKYKQGFGNVYSRRSAETIAAKTTFITWFPDSSHFVITDPFVIMVYNVEACFRSLPEYSKKIKEFSTPAQNDYCRVKFQYFHQVSFCDDLYSSVGSHILVTGVDLELTITTFSVDNHTGGALGFIWPSIHTESKQLPPLYAENCSRRCLVPLVVAHNKSNYMCINTEGNKIQMVQVYSLDILAADVTSRFQFKHLAKMPPNVKILPDTLSLNGNHIWCYDPHRQELSVLHFDKNSLEVRLQLTGRKAFKHLLVKDDGKYVLYVDESRWAELLMRTSTGSYITLFRYCVSINAFSTEAAEQFTGSVDHEFDNLEFLQDGRGSLNFYENKIRYQTFQIAVAPTNSAVILNQHFIYCNVLKNNDGTYTYEDVFQGLEEGEGSKRGYERIIDFRSKVPVKAFKLDGTPEDAFYYEDTLPVLSLHDVYNHIYNQNKRLDVNYEGHTQNQVIYVGIPENNYTVLWFLKDNALVGYRFHQAGRPDMMVSRPEIAWKIQLQEGEPRQLKHRNDVCNFYFGAHGKYLIIPKLDGGAKVYNVQDVGENTALEPIALIPVGDYFYVVDSDLILAVNHQGRKAKSGYQMRMMGVFDMRKNDFVGELVESEYFGTMPFVSPTSDYTLILDHDRASVFEAKKGKIVAEGSFMESELDELWTYVNSVVNFHQCIISPDGKILALHGNRYNDQAAVYSLPSMMKITNLTIPRSEETNKWCFTHDSKYLLIVINNKINIYLAETCALITSITLSNDLAKARIRTLTAIKESTELEMMFVNRNMIYFKRMPFYPTQTSLALSDLHGLLTRFSQKTSKDNLSEQSDIVSLITTSQQNYQLYLDSTYQKILCLFNDRGILSNYLEKITDRDLVFKYSPYADVVKTDVKHLASSANYFIDMLEEALDKDRRFPPAINKEALLLWLQDELQISYHRKLMRIISFLPLNVPVLGELKNELRTVNEIVSDDKDISSEWLEQHKKVLFMENSPNVTAYECFQTTFKFDMSKGSQFSIKYFEWMKRVSDEDLTEKFKGIIYYKWSRIYYSALIYSILLWTLNGLFVAFMGFKPDSVGLFVPILVLNGLFLIFEFKCMFSNWARFIRDPWNLIDLLTHGFSAACVIIIYSLRITDPLDPVFYRLAWLRAISFVLIGVRGLSMLRVFRPTRYLITMLFAVFHEMLAFLSVFGYVIFIYWFVCLVRPSLTQYSAEEDVVTENFFTSVQEALNIAFSNFDAAVDSTIVLVTSIMGNIVLGLVLLNYLIAIVSKTYETIADEKDLHDLKMVLGMIGEFDSFFSGLFKGDHAVSYFILLPVVNEDLQATQLSTIVSEVAAHKASLVEVKMSLAEQKASMAKVAAILAELQASMAEIKSGMNKPESTIPITSVAPDQKAN